VGAVRAQHQPGGQLEIAAVALAVEPNAPVHPLGLYHPRPYKLGAVGLGLLAEQLVQTHAVYHQSTGLAAAQRQIAAAGGVDVGAGYAVGYYLLPDTRLFQRARADQPGAVGRHADTPVLLQERDPQAGLRQVPR
jgi:hypothetical protein